MGLLCLRVVLIFLLLHLLDDRVRVLDQLDRLIGPRMLLDLRRGLVRIANFALATRGSDAIDDADSVAVIFTIFLLPLLFDSVQACCAAIAHRYIGKRPRSACRVLSFLLLLLGACDCLVSQWLNRGAFLGEHQRCTGVHRGYIVIRALLLSRGASVHGCRLSIGKLGLQNLQLGLHPRLVALKVLDHLLIIDESLLLPLTFLG